MVTLAEALLGLISIAVTVNLAVLGYIVRKLEPTIERVDTLWHSYFGIKQENGDGFQDEVEAEHSDLRDMISSTRQDHREMERRVERVTHRVEQTQSYLERLSSALKKNEQIDEVPDPNIRDTDETQKW